MKSFCISSVQNYLFLSVKAAYLSSFEWVSPLSEWQFSSNSSLGQRWSSRLLQTPDSFKTWVYIDKSGELPLKNRTLRFFRKIRMSRNMDRMAAWQQSPFSQACAFQGATVPTTFACVLTPRQPHSFTLPPGLWRSSLLPLHADGPRHVSVAFNIPVIANI